MAYPEPDAPTPAERVGRLLFRSMRVAADGRPQVGPTARTLGIRPDGDLTRVYFDVHVDPVTGVVVPGTGGLSVSPDSARNLPFHRQPPRLGDGGDDPLFVIDQDALGADLVYRPDPERSTIHEFIEPARPMTRDRYQQALASTRDQWTRHEH